MKNTIRFLVPLGSLLIASAAMAADRVVANSQPGGPVDYANAKPLKLPLSKVRPETLAKALTAKPVHMGTPGAKEGSKGNGKTSIVRLPVNKYLAAEEATTNDSGVSSQQFGTAYQPFTTSRADANGTITSRYYPFRAAGKLFFNIGSGSYICSAALIGRGVVVTAAHCVTEFGAGSSGWYSNFVFAPSYRLGIAPYRNWSVRRTVVMGSYLDGTASCASGASGVVCENDIAVMELRAQSGLLPGTNTGWFGYAWNGYGYTGSGIADNNLTHITQLGYPAGLDDGEMMERTDSYGYTSASMAYNTVIGSQMGGGSSGGPWVLNLGNRPAVTGLDGTEGTGAGSNLVVGTTSWGYTDETVRQQGASAFRGSNIVPMVDNICTNAASASVCN